MVGYAEGEELEVCWLCFSSRNEGASLVSFYGYIRFNRRHSYKIYNDAIL